MGFNTNSLFSLECLLWNEKGPAETRTQFLLLEEFNMWKDSISSRVSFRKRKPRQTKRSMQSTSELSWVSSSASLQAKTLSSTIPTYICRVLSTASNRHYPTVKGSTGRRRRSRQTQKTRRGTNQQVPRKPVFGAPWSPSLGGLGKQFLARARSRQEWSNSSMPQQAMFQQGATFYFGSVEDNRSTDFCQVWVLINGIAVNVCPHDPKCLAPGSRAIKKSH